MKRSYFLPKPQSFLHYPLFRCPAATFISCRYRFIPCCAVLHPLLFCHCVMMLRSYLYRLYRISIWTFPKCRMIFPTICTFQCIEYCSTATNNFCFINRLIICSLHSHGFIMSSCFMMDYFCLCHPLMLMYRLGFCWFCFCRFTRLTA